MARIEIGKYLVSDTCVCKGRLIFKGTRILVSDALALIARGLRPEEVAREYPGLLSPEAVREALRFIGKGTVREVLSCPRRAETTT
ncbi:MAG: DUF433 domain-containing protein [Candidatus Bipolaricaulota bacterium]|nr:DUF433 domain-containing protein [Candidatus Bipolaricaulota bacterium]MDW8030705.1 DUF433 domain-containing protein [Candidatus Bipolaricaulota bacterium]